MRTTTFKALSGDYKISDIKVNGAVGGGMENAYKINADGSWGQGYFYLTMDGTGYVEDGWYKDEFGDVPVSDADVLKFGEAFQVSSSSSLTFTFAGSVASGTLEVEIPAGSSMVGNPTPLEVCLSAIKVEGAIGGGMENAYKINSDGSWGQGYFYLTMDGTGYVEDGWYMDEFGDVPVTDADKLLPGESFQFSASSDIKLIFPSPL